MSQLVWTQKDSPYRFVATSGKTGKEFAVTYDCGIWRLTFWEADIPDLKTPDEWTFIRSDRAKEVAQEFEDGIPGADLPDQVNNVPNPRLLVNQSARNIFQLMEAAVIRPWWEEIKRLTGKGRTELLLESLNTPPSTPPEPTWEETNLFCPHCGHSGLKREIGEGDVEMGPWHKCDSCNETCYIG